MSSSESFFTKSDDMTSSVQFSERTTLSSRGYSLLVKAKRYGRWWLLKGLKEEYRHDGIFQAFLQKEYDILSQMQHPMVLSAFAFEDVEGVGRCIIMEWIDSLTLKEYWPLPKCRTTILRLGRHVMTSRCPSRIRSVVIRSSILMPLCTSSKRSKWAQKSS